MPAAGPPVGNEGDPHFSCEAIKLQLSPFPQKDIMEKKPCTGTGERFHGKEDSTGVPPSTGLARLAEPRANGRGSEGQASASTQKHISLCKKGKRSRGNTDIWYLETFHHPFYLLWV